MRRTSVLLFTVMLLGGFCAAQNDIPLGDVARKKSTVKAKRVVTDEDIPSTQAAPKANEEEKAPAKSDDATTGEPAIPAANPDGTPLSSEQKIQAMQSRVTQLKNYEATLAKHLKELSEKAENEPSEFRRNMYNEAIQRQTETLESFRKERAALETRQQKESDTTAPAAVPTE